MPIPDPACIEFAVDGLDTVYPGICCCAIPVAVMSTEERAEISPNGLDIWYWNGEFWMQGTGTDPPVVGGEPPPVPYDVAEARRKPFT